MLAIDQKIDAFMSVIKSTLKAKGISQQQFSKDLNISLATGKRWLSGRGVNLDILFRILDYLDLNLTNLAELMKERDHSFFYYTKKQEEFFSLNPSYLAYFDHLLRGSTPKGIAHKFKLSSRSQRRYLSALDKLQLIEVHPGDKITLRVKGEPKWRKGGALSKAFRQSALKEFFDSNSEKLSLSFYSLTKKDLNNIRSLFDSIREVARTSENVSLVSGKKTTQSCLVFAAETFEPKFLSNIEEL